MIMCYKFTFIRQMIINQCSLFLFHNHWIQIDKICRAFVVLFDRRGGVLPSEIKHKIEEEKICAEMSETRINPPPSHRQR